MQAATKIETTVNGRRLWEIKYRPAPRCRVRTVLQWHASAESAAELALIRESDREAICVSVRELSEAEAVAVLTGR